MLSRIHEIVTEAKNTVQIYGNDYFMSIATTVKTMAEITNLMRGSSASMEEGDKGSIMKPTQLEIRSLREEYSGLKKQYRREFAKQASQDTLIQDLGQDIYYSSTEPVENVDSIQKPRTRS